MNAVLFFVVVSVSVGLWSARAERPLPRMLLLALSVLVVVALYSRRVV